MLRTRRLTASDVFNPLGEIALVACGLVLLPLIFVAGLAFLVVAGLCALVNWLHDEELLGPVAFAVMAALVIIHFAGCASPHDPRDPEVWKPTTPANYPLPR